MVGGLEDPQACVSWDGKCPLLGAYCALGLYQALHHHLTSSPLKSYVAVPIVIPIVQVKELRCKVTKLIRGGI